MSVTTEPSINFLQKDTSKHYPEIIHCEAPSTAFTLLYFMTHCLERRMVKILPWSKTY